MRMNRKIRLLSLALALVFALAALPAAALADDAGNIKAFDGTGITDETEKGYLSMATAKPGESITIYVPVTNAGSDTATDMACSLPIDTDTSKYPFVIDSATDLVKAASADKKADSTDSNKLIDWSDKSLLAGEHGYFKFTATLSSAISSGYIDLNFNITYQYGGVACTDTVKITINVREASSSSSSSSGGSSYKSKPKVIVESYSFVEDPIYAGDTVTLRLVIANTSTREAITNLTLDLSNDSGAILPAPGGSSSIFIGTIEKDGAYAFSVQLQIAPDAEAKSQLLAIKLSYEGTRNRQEFEETASVSVPVVQKARVRINDPVVYDDAWVGNSVSVGVTLYNLGKSPLYNCLVDLEDNPNMTLEESYFGGNVASGGTMRADLSVTPLVGGEVTGNLRVTYEDVYGNQTETLLPLTLLVSESTDEGTSIYVSGSNTVISNGSSGDAAAVPAGTNLVWLWWTIGILAVGGVATLIGVKARKKRKAAEEQADLDD